MWIRSRTNMKRVDAFCGSCDSEFGIELIDSESEAKYCPVCGAVIDDVETYRISTKTSWKRVGKTRCGLIMVKNLRVR